MNVQFGNTAYLGRGLAEIARMAETDADLDFTGVPHELIIKLYSAGEWWHYEIRQRPGAARLLECLRKGTVRPILYFDSSHWVEYGCGRYPVFHTTAHHVLKTLVHEAWQRRDSTPLPDFPDVLSNVIPDVVSSYIGEWERVVTICKWGARNYLFTRAGDGTKHPLYALANARVATLCDDLLEIVTPKELGVPYEWEILCGHFEKLRHQLLSLSYGGYAAVAVPVRRAGSGVRTEDCVLLAGPPDMVAEVAHRIRSSK